MKTITQAEDISKIVQETDLKHIAIIMDGNRRWAKEKNLPSAMGHKKGVEALKTTLKACGGGTAPIIGNTSYKIGTNITGVKPNTKAADFLKGIPVNNGTATLVNAAGKEVSGNVATGHVVKIMAGGTVYASYPVVIYGDVNGDGTVTSIDLLIAQKHILGISKLSGAYLTAADSGKDGTVTSVDLLRTQKQILGLSSVIV